MKQLNKHLLTSCFWLFGLALICSACDKDADLNPESINTVNPSHGYIYIGCQTPPYYLKLDSIKTYCDLGGALPDTLPVFTLGVGMTTDTVCANFLDEGYADANDYDVQINYDSTSVDIQHNISDAVTEPIPEANIGGDIYQAGEYPYLGGIRISTNSTEATIQVVNVYVGGCFHNMIIWSSED